MSDKPSIDWGVWGVSSPQNDAETPNSDAVKNTAPDVVVDVQEPVEPVFDGTEETVAETNIYDPEANVSAAIRYKMNHSNSGADSSGVDEVEFFDNEPEPVTANNVLDDSFPDDSAEVESVSENSNTNTLPESEIMEENTATFHSDSSGLSEWKQFPGFETPVDELTDEELIEEAGIDGFQLPAYDEETPVDMVEQEESPDDNNVLTILPLPAEGKEESDDVEFHQHSHLAEDEPEHSNSSFWVTMVTTIVALVCALLALAVSIHSVVSDNNSEEKPAVTKTVTVTPTVTKTVTVNPNKP